MTPAISIHVPLCRARQHLPKKEPPFILILPYESGDGKYSFEECNIVLAIVAAAIASVTEGEEDTCG